MGQFHWEPDSYRALMRQEVPDYERLQAELVYATRGLTPRSILELGTGTGETTRRILAALPGNRAALPREIARGAQTTEDDAIARLYELRALGYVERHGDGWKLTRQAMISVRPDRGRR